MTETYEIHVKADFSAAHCLRGYEGNCERVHGHNWTVEIFVRCLRLNEIGIGIDFRDVKKSLGRVVEKLDHHHLNDLNVFKELNPTSENVARFIYRELGTLLNSGAVKVSKVKVSETPGAGVYYWED
jgi:6-pyruvoyltetrahydropterin/6-carboxytetrahydropterin synthase